MSHRSVRSARRLTNSAGARERRSRRGADVRHSAVASRWIAQRDPARRSDEANQAVSPRRGASEQSATARRCQPIHRAINDNRSRASPRSGLDAGRSGSITSARLGAECPGSPSLSASKRASATRVAKAGGPLRLPSREPEDPEGGSVPAAVARAGCPEQSAARPPTATATGGTISSARASRDGGRANHSNT